MQLNKKSFTMLAIMPIVLEFIFSDMGTFVKPDGFSPKVYGSHTIGQVFVPDFNNLTKIGVFINKEDLAGDGNIVFHLRSSIDSRSDIVRLEVKNSDIHDNWIRFRFPPTKDRKSYLYFFEFKSIKDSKGKALYFFLESSGRTIEKGVRFGITENIYNQGCSGGESLFDSKSQEWYLLFQTYCAWSGTSADAFSQALDRMSKDKGFFIFYILMCMTLASMIVYTGFLLKKSKKG